MQCAAVSTRSRTITVPVQKLPPEPTNITSGWLCASEISRAPPTRANAEKGANSAAISKQRAERYMTRRQTFIRLHVNNALGLRPDKIGILSAQDKLRSSGSRMSGQPLGIALSTRTVESRPTIRKHELWLCTSRAPSLTTRHALSQKMPALISLGKDAT